VDRSRAVALKQLANDFTGVQIDSGTHDDVVDIRPARTPAGLLS
jgi:hypothetical protein